MSRRILITGGAGFIGSNLVHYWNKNHPNDELYIVDKLTYAGNIRNLEKIINKSKINFIQCDIAVPELINNVIKKNCIDNIIHLAAESHVDRSILDPKVFIDTNIIGTYNLLQSFYSSWSKKGFPENWKFLHVSTDEVYGSLCTSDKKFSELTSYSPRSPYSASKASSDHLVMAWYHTYNLPVVIGNCSNNYGPYQYPEKLIPKIIINALKKEIIPIYGNGRNIRDWIYVYDHINALEKILTSAAPGNKYCIGGNNEFSNIQIANLICDLIDDLKSDNFHRGNLIKFVQDRPGHDFRYAIDSSLISKDLNWVPLTNFQNGLEKTISWYIQYQSWWEPLLSN